MSSRSSGLYGGRESFAVRSDVVDPCNPVEHETLLDILAGRIATLGEETVPLKVALDSRGFRKQHPVREQSEFR